MFHEVPSKHQIIKTVIRWSTIQWFSFCIEFQIVWMLSPDPPFEALIILKDGHMIFI